MFYHHPLVLRFLLVNQIAHRYAAYMHIYPYRDRSPCYYRAIMAIIGVIRCIYMSANDDKTTPF